MGRKAGAVKIGPRTRFPREDIPTKVDEIEAAASGSTIAEACKAAGVSLPTFYRWRQHLRADEPAPTVPKQGEQTRDLVLDAARTVFLRDGIGANINAVAQAAGVSRQTIHNLFGARDKLFAEVVQSLYVQLNAPALVLDLDADLVTVCEEVGRRHMWFAVDPDAVSLMRVALGGHRDHPEIAAVAYAVRAGRTGANAVGVITEKLTRELAAGTIREVNPYLAAENFIGSFSAFTRHRAMIGLPTPSAADLEERLQLAIDFFVRGLEYRPPRRPEPA